MHRPGQESIPSSIWSECRNILFRCSLPLSSINFSSTKYPSCNRRMRLVLSVSFARITMGIRLNSSTFLPVNRLAMFCWSILGPSSLSRPNDVDNPRLLSRSIIHPIEPLVSKMEIASSNEDLPTLFLPTKRFTRERFSSLHSLNPLNLCISNELNIKNGYGTNWSTKLIRIIRWPTLD